jgi:hypothetical protein
LWHQRLIEPGGAFDRQQLTLQISSTSPIGGSGRRFVCLARKPIGVGDTDCSD